MKKIFLTLITTLIFFKLCIYSANAQQLDLSNGKSLLESLLNQGLTDQLNQLNNDNNFQEEQIIEDNKNSFSLEEIEAIRKYYLKKSNELSPLEKEYSIRSNTQLRLQGYDIFEKLYDTNFSNTIKRQGAIQDDYIIGPGDEIVLRLQGEVNRVIRKKVSFRGDIAYFFTEPILISGISFGEFKKEIQRRVDSSFVETEAYITLNELKQISVVTSGEVNIPSQYQVSSMSNVLDVMLTSGGINKNGSLRNVMHISNGKEEIVDLYEILYGISKNAEEPVYVTNGSRLIVPPISNTVAIVGNVVKPGIYEIKKNEFTIRDVFNLAGKSSFSHKFFIKRVTNNLKEEIDFNLDEGSKVKNGDIIFVIPQDISAQGTVSVTGSVKYPFEYPLEEYPSVAKIIKGLNFLQENTFTLSFIVRSFNKNSQRYEYNTYNLLDVLRKKSDVDLNENDEVFIFNNKDLEFLLNEEVVNALDPSFKVTEKNKYTCSSVKKLSEHVKASTSRQGNQYFSTYNSLKKMISELSLVTEKNSNKSSTNRNQKSNCPKIFENNPDLLKEIINSMILIRGEVSSPGIYFAGEDLSLKSILLYAGYTEGKILISPDKRNINVISNNIKLIGSVRFPQKLNFNQKITLKQVVPDSSYVFSDTYPLFGLIKRRLPQTGVYNFITFNPEDIFSGNKDINLQNGDVIRFFSQQEISDLVETIIVKYKLLSDNIGIGEEGQLNLIQTINKETNEETDEVKDEKNTPNILNVVENIDSKNLEKYAEVFSIEDLEKIKLNLQKTQLDTTAENKNKKEKQINSELDNEDIKTENITVSKNLDEKLIIMNIIRSNLVKLSGSIILPGYYPIGETSKINSLISIAGGFENDADKNRIEIKRASDNKISNQKDTINPGDSIFVNPNNLQKDSIFLTGSIEQERSIGFQKDMILSDVLISTKDLKKDTFIYFGTIYRNPTEISSATYKAFSPQKVISENQDIKLEKGDVITFYSNDDIKQMLDQKLNMVSNNRPLVYQLLDKFSVSIKGAVKNPGKLLLGARYNYQEILDIAGGFTNDSNKENLDVLYPVKKEDGNIVFEQKFINFDTEDKFKPVEFGSVIRVPKFSNELNLGQVEILGAVKEPGNYQILENDTIYTLIKRSGGLSSNAFLDGLVFSRLEEKEREKISLERLKNELEKSISLSLESIGSKTDISSLAGIKEIINLASNAKPIGRIVGDFTNIKLLKTTFVTKGDTIFIPKKPTSITIVGETLTPGSILWDQKNSIDEYLESVAGFTELADKKRIFLIEPNGKSKRISGFWKNNHTVKPGSTLVVPRRIVLASNLEKISAVTSIIYQLTLSLAGIESVLND